MFPPRPSPNAHMDSSTVEELVCFSYGMTHKPVCAMSAAGMQHTVQRGLIYVLRLPKPHQCWSGTLAL